MRNPKWNRDEIILALDLYFDENRGSIDAKNPKIIELSYLLNKLPAHEVRADQEKFRNPNGVGLKLSNFLALDPSYNGKGMVSFSKLDEDVFNEFYHNRSYLRKLANDIKAIVFDKALLKAVNIIEDDETSELDSVREGQVLYKLHKVRERDKKIINAKKRRELQKNGKLKCEACDFDFEEVYGEMGKGFIECHHIVPLSEFDYVKETKLTDLALVCSNCHRMLHRNLSVLSIEEFRSKMKEFSGQKINRN